MRKPLLGTSPGPLYAVDSETFGRLAQLARASPLQGGGQT